MFGKQVKYVKCKVTFWVFLMGIFKHFIYFSTTTLSYIHCKYNDRREQLLFATVRPVWVEKIQKP